MKAYLGGAMLGSSVNASVEVVGVISKFARSSTVPSLSNSDFTKGEGWYQVILQWWEDRIKIVVDGLIYYDGTTFNGVLKGYNTYGINSFENTYIIFVPYANGNMNLMFSYLIHSSGYDMRTIE